MIKFLDLQKINLVHQQEIENALLEVFRSGWYLLGERLKNFEKNLALYIGSSQAIGVANGLDAISFADTRPQINAAPANAVTSKNICNAVGNPIFSIFLNISFENSAIFKEKSLMYRLVFSSFSNT